jgi:mRNA interferase HigB
MRIISPKSLREYAIQYPDAADSLGNWERVVRAADWRSIQDIRRVFPHADSVQVESKRIVTVFNLRGNRYRLIAAIHYNTQRVYVLRFLTHAEYSKDLWKDDL